MLKLFPLDDGMFAAADEAGYLPGVYPSEDAARRAAGDPARVQPSGTIRDDEVHGLDERKVAGL